MRVPKGLVIGSAGKSSQDTHHTITKRLREGYLPLLISSPIVAKRLKSPVRFLLVTAGIRAARKTTIEFRDGMRILTRGSASEFRATLETCIWDLYARDFSFSPSDDLVVIDIGGHIGTFSVSTAWRYPKSKVYTYEPLKSNFDMLQANVEANKLRNVFPEMIAVAGSRGSATLHVSEENTGGHSMFFSGDSDVIVNTIPLAEVFASHGIAKCDLLKIDCEGAEYDILFNTPSSVLKLVRNISLEYHNFGDRKGADIAEFLKAQGFTVSFMGEPQAGKNAIGLLTATYTG